VATTSVLLLRIHLALAFLAIATAPTTKMEKGEKSS